MIRIKIINIYFMGKKKIKELNIVANSLVLNIFSKIDIFRLDLGFNLTGAVDMKAQGNGSKIKITDTFVKKYSNDYNKIINKFGDIGILKFYSDDNLNVQELYIFDDKNIFEIELTLSEIKQNPRSYLSNLIEKIDTHNNPKKKITQTIAHNTDEAEPKLSLPKDEFIRQMVQFHENQFK